MTAKTRQRLLTCLLVFVLAVAAILTAGLITVISVKAASTPDGVPQITVFTHGWDASASYWSNDGNGKFVEDKDSLIYKLSQKAGGAHIYRIKTEGGDLGTPSYTIHNGYEIETANNSNDCSYIDDVSKHIIIVFDSKNKNLTNDIVYSEFRFMLNDVIVRVKELNPDKRSPKVNLIAHSRGGITDLQYALEFPENVDSMVSMGTPYLGSEVAKLVGRIIFGRENGVSRDGLDDIVDPEVYNKYYETWTSGYESKYKNINSIAIGGATTIDYQQELLSLSELEDSKTLSKILTCYSNVLAQGVTVGTATALYFSLPRNVRNVISENVFVDTMFQINSEVSFGTWYNDVLVPIDSQQGFSGNKNYRFTKHVKVFDSSNSSVSPKLATNFVPVIHNLEPYDPDLHKYILKNIVVKSGDTIDTEISNVNKIEYLDLNGTLQHKWQIKIRNTHKETRTYVYNSKMCFYDDAKYWNGLKDIEYFELEPGHTKIVTIIPYGTATSIAVCSLHNGTRYIEYADNLWTTNKVYTMARYSNTKSYYTYTQNGMNVNILGKNGGTWRLELTNDTGAERTFYYNSRMCNYGDARDWTGLSHISSVKLASGEKTRISITEYGTATSIAISYLTDNRRYIFYADSLDPACTMSSYNSSKDYTKYTSNGMKVGIVGKNGDTWLLELTNETGADKTFYYNSRMCFINDGKTWTGLSDVSSVYVASGETENISIREYGTATSIALSHTEGIDRYIFYADHLNADCTMWAYGFTKPTYYTQNGMQVAIVGKSGDTWTVQLTNKTGSEQTFEYNSRMCFEGDAQKWKGLSHISSVILAPDESRQIKIQEYGTATSIAISYMDGIYRKIFYAKELDGKLSTMSANANTIDTTQSDDGCVAEGTLVTLADGTRKAVEDLTAGEMLLVWNMQTGMFDSAPVLFVDSEPIGHNDVINLTFSDGSTVKVVSEHGFWDLDLNEYVYLDKNATQFIGHRFEKMTVNADGSYSRGAVSLVSVDIAEEVTAVYSPVTYSHLCYYVNDMLSMPGGITGLINIFDVNAETLTLDADAFAADVEKYGLFTYEEFYALYPVPENVFEAFNGRYLKVAIGKGLITYERIGALIERYSRFF